MPALGWSPTTGSWSSARGDRLIGRPPEAIAGLIEVRGFGIMRLDHCAASARSVSWSSSARRGRGRAAGARDLTSCSASRCPASGSIRGRASACAKIRLALAAERVGVSVAMGQIVLVTGMSGAGRTTALKALEDSGSRRSTICR